MDRGLWERACAVCGGGILLQMLHKVLASNVLQRAESGSAWARGKGGVRLSPACILADDSFVKSKRRPNQAPTRVGDALLKLAK